MVKHLYIAWYWREATSVSYTTVAAKGKTVKIPLLE